MTDFISIRPAEKGTAIVTLAPVDEDGVALTVGQLTNPAWQLMKTDGTVVNDRSFAFSPLSSLVFVLSGNDLALFGSSDNKKRVISFQAAYDSTAGSNLPLKAECVFAITPLIGQIDAE